MIECAIGLIFRSSAVHRHWTSGHLWNLSLFGRKMLEEASYSHVVSWAPLASIVEGKMQFDKETLAFLRASQFVVPVIFYIDASSKHLLDRTFNKQMGELHGKSLLSSHSDSLVLIALSDESSSPTLWLWKRLEDPPPARARVVSVSESGPHPRVTQIQEKMLVMLLFDDEDARKSDMLKLLSLVLTISRCVVVSGPSLDSTHQGEMGASRRMQSISEALHKMQCLDVPTRPILQIIAALGSHRLVTSTTTTGRKSNQENPCMGPRGGSAISHAGVLWLRNYESERLDQLPAYINEDIVSGLLDLHITPLEAAFYGQSAQHLKKSATRGLHAVDFTTPAQSGPSLMPSRSQMEEYDPLASQPSLVNPLESPIQLFPPDAFVQRLGNIVFKIGLSDLALGSNKAGSSGSGGWIAGLIQAFIQKCNKSSTVGFTLQDCLVASEQYRVQDAVEDALVDFRRKMGEFLSDPKSFMTQAPKALESAQNIFLNRCIDISDVAGVRESYRKMKERCDLEFQALVTHPSFQTPHGHNKASNQASNPTNINAQNTQQQSQQQMKPSASKSFLPAVSSRTGKSRLGGERDLAEGHQVHAEPSEVFNNLGPSQSSVYKGRQSSQISMDGSMAQDLSNRRASREGLLGPDSPRHIAVPSLLVLAQNLRHSHPSTLPTITSPQRSSSQTNELHRKGRSKTSGGAFVKHQWQEEEEQEEVYDIFSVEKMAAKRRKEQNSTPTPELYVREQLVARDLLSKGTVGMIEKPFGSLPPVFDLPQYRRVTRRETRGKSCPPAQGGESSLQLEQEGSMNSDRMQALLRGWEVNSKEKQRVRY